ncbi:MAG: cell division protein ZapE [Pseudomonadota bacterium]
MDAASNTPSSEQAVAQRYEDALRANQWQADPVQRRLVDALDRLRQQLTDKPDAGQRWWQSRDERSAAKGLYIWGNVGRGKTFVMDLFAASIPATIVQRSHFHRFMYDTHAALKSLSQEDPLAAVADAIAESTRVLCFDEFFVNDIGDAMILGRLMSQLFARGVALVATSNVPPDELYRNGLQRARFLPAIEAIKQHCDVFEMDSPTDYRLRLLKQSPVYLTPCDDAAMAALTHRFDELAAGVALVQEPLLIAGREIAVERRVPGTIWFSFDAICDGPRSQNDYIEIAKRAHTVLISGLPQMDGSDDNATRRFIALVDEFYDRRVNLVLAAASPIASLYTGERLSFEFERTISRLIEMQSEEYLAQAHRS